MSNFKYSLEICSEENLGTVYQLNRNEIIVGRGNVDISIDNPTLSTNHCLLRYDGTHITITDLQSRNGTAVNGRRIMTETTMTSGDILTLGEVTFRVTASTNKERLSSLTSSTQEKKKSIFGKIVSKLPNSTAVQSPYEKVSRNLLLLLVLLSWVILLGPLYFILQDKLTESRVERACSLVYALAASNIEAMRQGNRIMVDSSIIDKEPGVSLALIMTNQGIVWAPESLVNKKASDSYGENAVNAEQLLIQQRDDGQLDITLPIKHYNFKNGQSIKLGVARIIYDMKQVYSGPPWFLVIGLSSVVYLVVAFYFSRKIVHSVKQDLLVFQEDCEDVIKGNATFLEEKYSPEFNGLTVTFNRMLRKLGKSLPEVTDTATECNPTQLMELVGHLKQAALLVNSRNIVVNSSAKAHELFDSKAECINNKSLLEIHCEKNFYQDLLEFVCEATQKDTKKEVTLATNPHGYIHLTSIPVAEGYSLLLLSVES